MVDQLGQKIHQKAKVWASQIRLKANANLGKYRSLIRIESKAGEKGEKIEILSVASPTTMSAYGDIKDVARAYEYGSGLHSTGAKGKKRKYRIAPKRKKVLAFYWDKVDESSPVGGKFLGISSKSKKALFKYVDHPGVAAANGGKGYLRPAIAEVRKSIRKELTKEMRDAYIGGIRKAFKK